jgi:hypothetical protein
MSGLASIPYEAAVELHNCLIEQFDQFMSEQGETPSLTRDEYLGRAAVFNKAKMALNELLIVLKVSK